MEIYYHPQFRSAYHKLALHIKNKAEAKERVFRKDPFDSLLKTHKLTGKLKDYHAFSIDYQYRIIFEFAGKDTIWFHSVGTHEIYN